MTTRSLPVLSPSRSCGTCSLCCTLMGVKELGKDRNVKCSHVSVTGACRIYAGRPDSCRAFRCLWLQGSLPFNLQPSRIGAVATANVEGTALVWHVAPRDRGMWRKRGPFREYLLLLLRRGVRSVIVCGDERFLLGGPPGHAPDYTEQGLDGETRAVGLIQDEAWPAAAGER